jgi:signal transduction histidine kinase
VTPVLPRLLGRRGLARGLLLAAIAVLELAPAGVAWAQDNHKQVLVLYSTRRDSEFSSIGERELPRILDVGLERELDYYSEFIDVARFPDPSYQIGFGDFLRLKYRGIRFDLVIAMQDIAVEFVNRNRDGLFLDTPAVFLANTPAARVGPNATGLILERNLTATLALVETLQPDVRNIFVVSGSAPSDKAYEQAMRAQTRPFESRLTFHYLSGLSTDELERRLSRLPAHSVVYYLLVTEDGARNKYHPLEYVDRVAAVANAPTYCWVDSAMDHGIVGGNLYSQTEAIGRTADLALRVLRGEKADSIDTSAIDLNSSQVDWRQLRRWGIDEARVPAGTVVRFREPTIWDRYKSYILAALALLIVQSGLIAGLLIQRVRRRRAEVELRKSQDHLLASYERIRDLGSRLLQAQETERSRIARELHDDINQQVALLTMDLEVVGVADHDEVKRLAAEALARAQEIGKSVHDLSHRLHPAKLRLIGLVAALQALRLELSQSGIAIAFTHDNVPSTLSADVTLCLFRVVQEALQNAIKYSKAREVSVHLAGSPLGLTLSVVDDGAGFDVDAVWGKGLGLVSMKERLEAIGGSLEIRSTPGLGTRVEATAPLDVVQGGAARPDVKTNFESTATH